jgi:hypothetical protein
VRKLKIKGKNPTSRSNFSHLCEIDSFLSNVNIMEEDYSSRTKDEEGDHN